MHFFDRLKLKVRIVYEKIFVEKPTEHVYALIGGPIFFQSLRSAVELNLFDILDEEGACDQDVLQQKLGLEEQPLRILLTTLLYLRLLHKKGSRYSNSYITQVCFCTKSPKNINHIVRWQHAINYSAMPFLLDSIRQNRNVGLQVFKGQEPTLYERLAHEPELENTFQQAMMQISRQANDLLKKYLDLKDVNWLVDVGGGFGENITQLITRWPHLKGSVFDLPSVSQATKDRFARSDDRERLTVFAGNCFLDPFPVGPDAFIFCHFLTIWSKDKNLELLRKAYVSLPRGGKVIIFNMMQNNDGSGPSGAAMGSPYFLTLATGEGMLYTWQEYQDLIAQAGFSRIETIVLPTQHGIIIGTK